MFRRVMSSCAEKRDIQRSVFDAWRIVLSNIGSMTKVLCQNKKSTPTKGASRDHESG